MTMPAGWECGRTEGQPERYEMIGSDNYVQYALDIPMAVAPGTAFAYCRPGAHVLSAMLANATSTNTLDFARDNLFDRLGIKDAEWPEDPQGVNHGWGDLRLHPRDMARIGQLFLNAGDWNGVQVVSKAWAQEATQKLVVGDTEENGYG